MKKHTIFFNEKIPVEIDLLEISDVYINWHKELKIIYLLKGKILVEDKKSKIILLENNFIIINSYDFITIQSFVKEPCVFMEILIDTNFIDTYYLDFSRLKFECCSINENISKIKYDTIYQYIDKFLEIIFNSKQEEQIMLVPSLIEFCLFLITNFKAADTLFDKKNLDYKKSNKERLLKILRFVEENYLNESLNINTISNYIQLTPQYILKLFKDNFGIGLNNYINSLRIKKSIKDLLYSDKNIIEIAIDCGFSNAKIYYRIFKKIYSTSPRVYKENILNDLNNLSALNKNNSLFKENNHLLSELRSFLIVNKKRTSNSSNMKNITENIDLKNKREKINLYWKSFISSGKASNGLNGDIQTQIKELKEKFDSEYIRFINIFSDKIGIYNEKSNGEVFYNYAYIDKFIDFLVELKIKPFINLGYMSYKLADKNQYAASSNINVSYPKSIKLWNKMIYDLINHFIERYGEKEVMTWYFEIWNNPNFSGIFWYESEEKFFQFFKETFNTIKSISNNLIVGGPSCILFLDKDNHWVDKFLYYIEKNNLQINFFSFHIYNVEYLNKINIDKEFENHKLYFECKNIYLQNFYKEKLKKLQPNIEIIVSELNFTPYTYFLNDTCYINTFILSNLLNNLNTVDKLIYWTFTENKTSPDIFYGGLGVFSSKNLKKASYNVFYLLNKLGNELISKGEHHLITSNQGSIQILLYYYDIRHIENVEELYNSSKEKEIQLNIKNIPKGKYSITKYYLDKSSGSTYDAWLEMGSPQRLSEEMFEYLKSKEKMKMKFETIIIEKEIFFIKETIKSDSVIFIELNLIN